MNCNIEKSDNLRYLGGGGKQAETGKRCRFSCGKRPKCHTLNTHKTAQACKCAKIENLGHGRKPARHKICKENKVERDTVILKYS